MKLLVIILFLIVNVSGAFSQDTINPLKYKEYGLNVTGLVTQLVPFNGGKLGRQRYAFSYKSTRITRSKKLKTFRFGLGISSISGDGKNFGYNLRLGREEKHTINEHWTFITGNDFVMFVESSNIRNNFFGGIPNIGVGYSRPLGIEYHLNNRLSIYTESALQVVTGFPPFAIRMLPPTSFFLNVKL